MEIVKLQCFKNTHDLSQKEMIDQIFLSIDKNFLFNFMKKIYKLENEKFKYSKKQFNNILIDNYFNDGKCSIYLIDYFPKNIAITTEVVTSIFSHAKINKDINLSKDFDKKDFYFFYNIFSFIFQKQLNIKSEKLVFEITSWLMWERNINIIKTKSIYEMNKIKRMHWINFLNEIKKEYGKEYNKIIIHLNESINKSVL